MDQEYSEEKKGERPAFRVLKSEKDADGNRKLVEVGAMWKKHSKAGSEFYAVKIGEQQLLAFPNR